MKEPTWANIHYPPIDYQDIIYYSSPKSKKSGPKDPQRGRPGTPQNLRQARHPPEGTRNPGRRRGRCRLRLGLRGHHLQKRKLKAMGIIFGSFSEAVREHPDLVRQYLGSVVPSSDNSSRP